MIKKIIISCVAALICSVAASASTYCVWVSCLNQWGTTIKNANQKSIVRTAEFANGKYYLNQSVFAELVKECADTGTPIVGGMLYGRNAGKLGLGFMWELNSADQAARNMPNGPGLVPNDKTCQAME